MSTAAHDPHAHDAAHAGHGHVDANTGHHDPHLAHHFDTPEQQFSTGKLGMWTFLATEVLMFGGLFCAYAVYRYNHPQVYLWSHHALDATWGMINTIVLLASSFTMAWGVRAAQLNQRGLLKLMLILTFMGGVVFMVVKTIEYQNKWKYYLFPGKFNSLNAKFQPVDEKADPAKLRAITIEHVEHHMLEAAGGHGAAAEHGSGHEEAPDRGDDSSHQGGTSSEHNARAVTDNASAGRGHDAPAASQAPNPEAVHNPNVAAGTGEHQPATSQPVRSASEGMQPIANFFHDPQAGTPEATNIRPPAFVASGINPDADKRPGHTWTTYAEMEPTDRVQLNTFFSIYFMMTGLHGIHVLVGMGIIAWLYLRAARGDFSSHYFTPVDLGGLYWHLVDLIWIFLFPLLYLIH